MLPDIKKAQKKQPRMDPINFTFTATTYCIRFENRPIPPRKTSSEFGTFYSRTFRTMSQKNVFHTSYTT